MSPSDAQHAAQSLRAYQPADGVFPPPWCPQGTIEQRRTESCGVIAETYTYLGSDGEVDGHIYVNQTHDELENIRTHDWYLQVQVEPTSADGTIAPQLDTFTLEGLDDQCVGDCSVTDSTLPVEPVQVGIPVNLLGHYTSTLSTTVPDQQGASQSTLTFAMVNPYYSEIDSPAEDDGTVVRCDNQMPGSSVLGCVDPSVVPTLEYTGGNELSRHILAAQESGLPGGYLMNTGALHRLTDKSTIAGNRSMSCRGVGSAPAGDSCDEYPFASTYEGAATGSGSGRTFDFCHITKLPTGVTGPTGYSACFINADQNRLGGSQLATFYHQNRIIDQDAFTVQAY